MLTYIFNFMEKDSLQILKLEALVNKHTGQDILVNDFPRAQFNGLGIFLRQPEANIGLRYNWEANQVKHQPRIKHAPVPVLLNGFV
jgi:hypothetical protein